MKYLCVKNLKPFIPLLFIAPYQLSYAEETIKIPCPKYKRGDVFTYKNSLNGLATEVMSIVKTSSDDIIELVSDSTTHEQKTRTTTVYKKKDGNIFLAKNIVFMNGIDIVNAYEPAEPICGEVPKNYSFKLLVSGAVQAGIPMMENNVNLTKVGEKRITTALGNVNAVIIKKVMTMTMEGTSHTTTNSSISYNVSQYGKIKDVMTITMLMPDYSSMDTNNDAYKQIFSGEIDASNIESQLDELKNMSESLSPGDIKYKEMQTKNTIELVNYSEKN